MLSFFTDFFPVQSFNEYKPIPDDWQWCVFCLIGSPNILADEFPPKYKHRSWHEMWFILLRFLLNIQHRCKHWTVQFQRNINWGLIFLNRIYKFVSQKFAMLKILTDNIVLTTYIERKLRLPLCIVYIYNMITKALVPKLIKINQIRQWMNRSVSFYYKCWFIFHLH